MPQITFYKHDPIPLEMHKVRIVQKLNLLPTDERLQKIKDSGYNTFQLHNSFQFSRIIPGPSVCISHFSRFLVISSFFSRQVDVSHFP